mmetsp:Transcript_10478/g.14802  ORF Transcript_10478/g.14802 Transcript_10478/m.14802 type:complete len:484 (-) Transcript_10478:107-1558(-)
MTSKELLPLQNLLDSVLGRLSTLESKLGVTPTEVPRTASQDVGNEVAVAPALTAYDEHISRTVTPFVSACDALGGLKDIGANINTIWLEMRKIIEIGTACKKPKDVQAFLTPKIKPIQNAMAKIRQARLDRKYDWHIKGILEMLASVSWIMMSAPPAPSTFVKDTIGSCDFWCNRIRKEYKGKDEKQIKFCDTIKAVILDLSSYLKEYHLSGLMWNPRGMGAEEFTPASSELKKESKSGPETKSTVIEKEGAGNIMAELAKKRSKDGSSAATGLKKVSRDQQTWRKEYKKPVSSAPASTNVKPSLQKKETATPKKKLATPVCEYQTRGFKWVIENQTKTSNANGLCTVDVKDQKEQAYIYKCENATIKINGKIKSIIMDTCTKTNLIFESTISACEIVNCKSVQIQSTGLCPSYSIDKTDGCLIYLSKEASSISSFVTSKSTEMNISWPDEKSGEQKECPIPEQFVHKLVDGSITSDVSDLYH